MPTLGQQQINLGAIDLNLALNTALPVAGANVTTAVLDLEAVGPNSDAWRTGRFAVVFPNLPENTAGAGITVALQAAPPSLLAGSPAGVAPNIPPPGAFAAPLVAQTLTVAAVAGTGSFANVYYFTPAFDANGNTMQFYQFVITVPAQVNTLAENILIAWVDA
jgi:hypothetical protein